MRLKGIAVAAVAVLVGAGVDAAELLRIGGTGAALESMRQLTSLYAERASGLSFEIPPSLGSTGALRAVRARAIDIGVSGRPFTAAEMQGGLRQLAFANTPFTFVTSHPAVSGIKTTDLPQFYMGTRTTWDDGRALRLILRPKFDSDSELLMTLFPDLGPALQRAWARREITVAATDQDNAQVAERLEGSLTVMTLMQVMSEWPSVRPLTLDGVQPTIGTQANPSYPYMKTMYFVVQEPPSEHVRDFLAFVATPEAGALLLNSGALPIKPLRAE